ncbi:hypothetical protein F511_44282 [Dorcoceras hygrometricum]|uniref:H(+)-transporting two-sector ATPase n=1 Tax=Dorcoceras hygrometricum TaxID=472368 RepID=A0A2Z7AMD3_9LAMI|nr:hypothetical protein F511_44282 [Dorcoceras hygrometricum]
MVTMRSPCLTMRIAGLKKESLSAMGEASEEAVDAEANYPSFGFDPSVTREGGMTPSGFYYPSYLPETRKNYFYKRRVHNFYSSSLCTCRRFDGSCSCYDICTFRCYYRTLKRISCQRGIYPAVDPLDSTSTMLQPRIVGEEHYETAQSKELSKLYNERTYSYPWVVRIIRRGSFNCSKSAKN